MIISKGGKLVKKNEISIEGREIEVIYHKTSKKNAPIIFTTHGFDFNMDDYR